jgi:hypothetical protein
MNVETGTDGSIYRDDERVDQFLEQEAELKEQEDLPRRPAWPWIVLAVVGVVGGAIAIWWQMSAAQERDKGCSPTSQEVIDNVTF